MPIHTGHVGGGLGESVGPGVGTVGEPVGLGVHAKADGDEVGPSVGVEHSVAPSIVMFATLAMTGATWSMKAAPSIS